MNEQQTINTIRNELLNRLRAGPVQISGVYWSESDLDKFANFKPEVRTAQIFLERNSFLSEYTKKQAERRYLDAWFTAYDEILSNLAVQLSGEVSRYA